MQQRRDVLEILDYGSGMASYTQTPQSATTGISDSDEPGVLAVGAIDPPASGTIAAYSSQGPTNDGRLAPDISSTASFTSTVKPAGFAGTSAALLTMGASLFLGPQLIPLALVAGYGPAWIGHFFFEKNKPATFQYPAWSLRADFRMYAMTWTGRIADELRQLGLA